MRQSLNLATGVLPDLDGVGNLCRGNQKNKRQDEEAQDPEAYMVVGCESCGVLKGEHCERSSGKKMFLRTHTIRQAAARSLVVIQQVQDIMERAKQWE